MASDLHFMQLTELATKLCTREISPVEVTRQQLSRIASLDTHLHSYARVTPEAAIAAATRAEEEILAGRYRGPLHGMPIGVKDLFWTKDSPTSAGMLIHRHFQPPEDATVVRRLREAGAVLLGKLQMTEGAYSDHHPTIEPPRNPWNGDYWTGISSSGPGAATAAGLCYGAVASDTGGSIRWPCVANSLTGLKSTWGRVSRFGVMELAASLDHVGPMARSARDVGEVFAVIRGPDEDDPTSLGPTSVGRTSRRPGFEAASSGGVFRIGFDSAWNSEDVDPSVRAMLAHVMAVFEGLGSSLMEVSAPAVTQAVIDWAPACALEAAVAHELTYPARRSEYGEVLASVLDAGRAVSAFEYQKIRLRRMDLRGRFSRLLQDIDVLLTPVQPFAPLDLASIRTLGTQPDLILKLQRYTAPFNLTGHPTLTLPGGFSDAGLPMGFQLVSAHWAEQVLLEAGVAFQEVTDWHTRHPPI
jgi:amidase